MLCAIRYFVIATGTANIRIRHMFIADGCLISLRQVASRRYGAARIARRYALLVDALMRYASALRAPMLLPPPLPLFDMLMLLTRHARICRADDDAMLLPHTRQQRYAYVDITLPCRLAR